MGAPVLLLKPLGKDGVGIACEDGDAAFVGVAGFEVVEFLGKFGVLFDEHIFVERGLNVKGDGGTALTVLAVFFVNGEEGEFAGIVRGGGGAIAGTRESIDVDGGIVASFFVFVEDLAVGGQVFAENGEFFFCPGTAEGVLGM